MTQTYSTESIGLETSFAYCKQAKTCKKAVKLYLISEHYSYNNIKKQWKIGKQTVDYETIYITVLQWSRTNNRFREHGLFTEEILAEVIKDPDFTCHSCIKSNIIRRRGSRISGKEIFLVFCKHTGIEIIGTIDEFIAKNSHIVKKFYDYLAKYFPYVSLLKRARIFGKLCSSVFVGLALRDDQDTDETTPSSTVTNIGITPSKISLSPPKYKFNLYSSPPI